MYIYIYIHIKILETNAMHVIRINMNVDAFGAIQMDIFLIGRCQY